MHAKTTPFLLTVAFLLAVVDVRSEEAPSSPPPLTISRALKLGIEKLTAYTDDSEAGQDRAALLYATAKRLETESALAQKSVEAVVALDEWRKVLSNCRAGSCNLAYLVNGGGTMYSHGAARDCAAVEDFLAGFAKGMPLPAGKGSSKAQKKVAGTVAFLKKLKPFESGDASSDTRAKVAMTAEVAKVLEHWESLKYMLDELPADQADQVAAFAMASLEWLK